MPNVVLFYNEDLHFLDYDEERPFHLELVHTVFRFWVEWICVILTITAWICITFLLPVPNCPTGYLGPGGRHEHGKYYNCTGGQFSQEEALFCIESVLLLFRSCWIC